MGTRSAFSRLVVLVEAMTVAYFSPLAPVKRVAKESSNQAMGRPFE